MAAGWHEVNVMPAAESATGEGSLHLTPERPVPSTRTTFNRSCSRLLAGIGPDGKRPACLRAAPSAPCCGAAR